MLLITKILAVIILLICLGFIAYWAIAIIKGDCVLKVMKSKRTPFHVESMDMKSVTLSCTLPIKNVGKQLGTIMDAFVRVYLPFEQYDEAVVTAHLTDFDMPRPDDYWQAFILDPGKTKKFLITLEIKGRATAFSMTWRPSLKWEWMSFIRSSREATTTMRSPASFFRRKSSEMRSMNIKRR